MAYYALVRKHDVDAIDGRVLFAIEFANEPAPAVKTVRRFLHVLWAGWS